MDDTQRIHITKLALEMLLKHGVRYFRVDDLAHEAGISKRTLYEIFKDKENIIRQAAYLFFEMEEEEYNSVGNSASNFIEALIFVLYHVSNRAQDTWRLRDDLKKYYNTLFEEIIKVVMKRRQESMVTLFNIGVEQGYVRANIDIQLSIVTLQYLFKTLAESGEEISKNSSTPHPQAGQQIISCYFRGLCTIKGIELMDNYIEKIIKSK